MALKEGILVAIDPGVSTGWARFVDGYLFSCDLGDPPIDSPLFHPPGETVIEVPQVYRHGKGDPNDLIKLAIQVGRYAQRASHSTVRLVKPAEWKGQTPKEMHGLRVLAALNAFEDDILARVKCAKSKKHNVIDAVGLGLWAVGRLER